MKISTKDDTKENITFIWIHNIYMYGICCIWLERVWKNHGKSSKPICWFGCCFSVGQLVFAPSSELLFEGLVPIASSQWSCKLCRVSWRKFSEKDRPSGLASVRKTTSFALKETIMTQLRWLNVDIMERPLSRQHGSTHLARPDLPGPSPQAVAREWSSFAIGICDKNAAAYWSHSYQPLVANHSGGFIFNGMSLYIWPWDKTVVP